MTGMIPVGYLRWPFNNGYQKLAKKQEFPGYCSTRGNYRKPRHTDKFAARWPVSGGAISSDYADSVCTILNSYSVPVPVLRAVKLKEIKGTNIFYGTRNTGMEHRAFSTHHSPLTIHQKRKKVLDFFLRVC